MNMNNQSLQKSSHHDSVVYLWRQRILMTTPPHQSRTRRYYADCILFGYDGPLRVTLKDGTTIEDHIIMIPARTSFFMEVDGDTFGLLFLDYLGLDFKKAQDFAQKSHLMVHYSFSSKLKQRLLATMASIHRQPPPMEEVERRIIGALEFDPSLDQYNSNYTPENSDPRLARIINLYLDGELDLDATISQAAEAVNLSVSRVNQLFTRFLNLNFRTFRNRQKIQTNLIAFAFGKSNTQAALESGFVDQAHFCRRFKESAGIKVSAYRAKNIKHVCFIEENLTKRYLSKQPIYDLTGDQLSD